MPTQLPALTSGSFGEVLNAAVYQAVISANATRSAANQPLLTDAHIISQIATAFHIS